MYHTTITLSSEVPALCPTLFSATPQGDTIVQKDSVTFRHNNNTEINQCLSPDDVLSLVCAVKGELWD